MSTDLSKRQARDAAALSDQLAGTADLALRLRLIASAVPGRIVFSTSHIFREAAAQLRKPVGCWVQAIM